MPANLENSAVATRQISFHSIPKKGNAKECSSFHTIALISHASKVMLKILQARLQQHVNCELPDVQAAFRKSRGTRDQIASICWITEKSREFQTNIHFCFIDYAKAFDGLDHNEPEIKLSTSSGSSKSQESSRQTSISTLLTMQKPLMVWITIHCGKF